MFAKSILTVAALATVTMLAGPARAALISNALISNALTSNALISNALISNALISNGLRSAATAANAGPSAPAPTISGILLPSGERLIAR